MGSFNRVIRRVGGEIETTLRSDVRVVSATHCDLPREVAAGRFRENLCYRLNVIRIAIPPLRERNADIPLLTEAILRRLERRYGWSSLTLTPEAALTIRTKPWPGNVRQLENVLARAAVAARGRPILPEHLEVDGAIGGGLPAEPAESPDPLPLRALLADVERRAIQRALIACDGNRTRAAERLGISRRQLFDKVREYDLQP